MQPISALFVYATARLRQSLLLALIGGLVIGGSIAWPIYYYGSGKAAQRNHDKRLALPEKGKTINKYGYACLYAAYTTDSGRKYYNSLGHIAPLGDTFQQFFCTERQAQDAGYILAQ